MFGENKKGLAKNNRSDAKENRKHKHVRTPNNLLSEKKNEQKTDKLTNPEPGPEFYANLKRETDETVKIVEETNSKYNKKVVESNWKKYEAPIESYEERQEVENMGADFEKLVSAPSSGGHFQFKHEKSWNTVTTTNQYDKYFEINMADLADSLSTIPFYECNNLDLKLFSDSDLVSMHHKANRFQQKYQQNDISDPQNKFMDPCDTIEAKLKECLVSNEDITLTDDERKQRLKEGLLPDLDVEECLDEKYYLKEAKSSEGDQCYKSEQTTNTFQGSNKDGIADEEDDLEEWLDDFLSKG